MDTPGETDDLIWSRESALRVQGGLGDTTPFSNQLLLALAGLMLPEGPAADRPIFLIPESM